MGPVILRRELPSDRAAVHEVHARAFARPDKDVAVEAVLADALRDDGDAVPQLCLVAEADGLVVGSVICSRAVLGDRASLGLGPVGVLPEHQGRGVGSALVHGALAAADALDAPEMVLLGDPRFYRRFGFELAVPIGVLPPEPAWEPYWQVRRLTSWDGAAGPFRYAPAFDLV